jgi:hypothetical protein
MAQWQPCRGIEGADVTDMVVKDSVMFITCSGNGIYAKNINEGDWYQSYGPFGVNNIVIAGEALFANGPMTSFVRSLDNGETWNEVDYYVYFMDAIGSTIFITTMDTVFRSDDYGETWYSISNDLTGIGYSKIFCSDSALFIEYIFDSIFFTSYDFGVSWDSLSMNGLPNGLFWVFDIYLRYGTLWMATDLEVYILPANQTEWISINDSILANTFIYEFSEYNEEFYCCTEEGVYCFNSSDSTWFPINNGLENKNTRCMYFYYSTFFCGNEYGPYFYNNQSTWEPFYQGLFQLSINSVSFNNNEVWTCERHRLYKSENYGEDFSVVPVDCFDWPFSVYATDSLIYLVSYKDGFYISRDNGVNWEQQNNGLNYLGTTQFGLNENYYFINAPGLNRTPVDSIYWQPVPNCIGTTSINEFVVIDSVILIQPHQNQMPTYRSTDNGESFNILQGYSPSEYSTLYAKDGIFYILDTYNYYILESSDYGESWIEIPTDSLCRGYTMDVIDEYYLIGGMKFDLYPIGHYIGITDNFGLTWTEIGDNLPQHCGPSISIISVNNNRIFAHSVYNSLYYRDDLLTFINSAPSDIEPLIILYPNPASGFINYKILDENVFDYSIKVFTINGQLIYYQPQNTKNKGIINLNGCKPGLYLIKFESDEMQFIKKIII